MCSGLLLEPRGRAKRAVGVVSGGNRETPRFSSPFRRFTLDAMVVDER
jgi:hypothetical protein